MVLTKGCQVTVYSEFATGDFSMPEVLVAEASRVLLGLGISC